MGKYSVEIMRSAFKEISKLPSKDIKRILDRISALSEDPRPQDCKKLTNEEKYRIRCGNYRIIYAIEDDRLIVYVVKIGHRKNVYR